MRFLHGTRKENEITKAPQALKMVELARKVVTGDAMHTQRGLATQIVIAQGDYVLPVKENQPQLYKNIQALFAPEYPNADKPQPNRKVGAFSKRLKTPINTA